MRERLLQQVNAQRQAEIDASENEGAGIAQPEPSPFDPQTVRASIGEMLGQRFGSDAPVVDTFNAFADELQAMDPKLYSTVLLLMKMMAEENPECLKQLVESTQQMMQGLSGRTSTVQSSRLSFSIAASNAEASFGARFSLEGLFEVVDRVAASQAESAGMSAAYQRLSVRIDMSVQQGDPLVLDLHGDGIELRGVEDGVDFDLHGNGKAVRTGFIQGDDAFLFLDENGNRVADSGKELFGNQEGHANGFSKLATHDMNGDQVIDAQDSVYERLRLWQDLNGDGVNQLEEVLTLREAGVESIDIDYLAVSGEDGKGNHIGQYGGFARADGSRGFAADAWLGYLYQHDMA